MYQKRFHPMRYRTIFSLVRINDTQLILLFDLRKPSHRLLVRPFPRVFTKLLAEYIALIATWNSDANITADSIILLPAHHSDSAISTASFVPQPPYRAVIQTARQMMDSTSTGHL